MASASLSRSISASPTNPDKFTVSVWVKKSKSAEQVVLGNYASSNFRAKLQFKSDDKLEYYQVNDGGVTAQLKTNRKFRETSAWYHVLVQFDTSQGTASDTIKIYINGTQETSFETSTYPAQNLDMRLNQASTTLKIGQDGNSGNYFDGQMTHVHLADGQTYAPTIFGETDSTTGIWKPKPSPSGVTYGDDGFFLKMDNSANMGLDSSGNSNNFTTSGTIIQNKDTPSNVFAVWNKLDWGTTYFTLSDSSLTAQSNAWVYTYGVATLGVSKGKYYWEVEYDAKNGGNRYPQIGITSTQSTATSYELGHYANDWSWYINNTTGKLRNNNSDTNWGNYYEEGDIIGVALDCTNNKLYFSKNGVFQESGNPSAGSGGISITAAASTPLGFYFPAICYFDGTYRGTFKANFGNGYFGTTAVASAQNPDDGVGIFEYDPPTGYKALCTKSINAQEYS